MGIMEMDKDEKNILTALRTNPKLKKCFLEMVDITEGEVFESVNNGDDAEEAVVNAIQKTGIALLQGWMDKKNEKATQEIGANQLYRRHKKKAQMANLSREN